MRIILVLAAAAGAAAISGPAPAQASSNYPAASRAAPASHGRGVVRSGRPDFRPGMPGRFRHRPWGRHGRPDRGAEGFAYPFGFIESYESVDPHGTGFFAGGGGMIRMQGGRPLYDYDRSYPYEWRSPAGPSVAWVVSDDQPGPDAGCSLERGVRVCRGRR
jgi:hypothetical protein